MTEEPPNLVLEQLRAIREEQTRTSHKIGALAEGMVSIRKQMGDMGNQVDGLSNRIDGLSNRIDGLRADMRMVALAVDEHTTRLDRIETRLNIPDAE